MLPSGLTPYRQFWRRCGLSPARSSPQPRAPHCAVTAPLRGPTGQLSWKESRRTQQPESLAVDRPSLLSQARHPGQCHLCSESQWCQTAPQGLPSPHHSLHGDDNHQLRKTESNRCPQPPPPQRGLSHTRPPAGEDGWALPGQRLGTEGSCHRRLAAHPRRERAIKRSGARRGIRAIFPSHGRLVVF